MDFSNVVKESEEVEGAETGSEPAIWSQVSYTVIPAVCCTKKEELNGTCVAGGAR